jgi:glycosyltransferase involved in cell wall biosynthesis
MRPERIRVLAFVTVFDVGGTERQIVSLARGLDASRFDLRIACFKRSGAFLAELESQQVPVTAYGIRSLHGFETLREQVRFARYLRRERIQVLHTFNFYPNMFAVPTARLAGVPAIVATLRDMGDLWTPMQRRAQRWVCRMAHRVVANAGAVREQALREGYDPRRTCVIRNGLDLSRFSGEQNAERERRVLGLPSGVPVVAVFSRLNHPVKGIDCFLEAASRVASVHRDVHFLIVGDGPIRRDLERLAHGLGLKERVRFVGFRADVARTMSAVTISVVPSRSEGLSNVLLESMAARLPVVATRVGGNPEVVEDGTTGMLVPSRTPAALAGAISALLADPDRAAALGRAGRRRVEALFPLSRMLRETESLYESLLGLEGWCGDLTTRGAA